MPDSSIAEAERATLDARNAIESEHRDEHTAHPPDELVEVFVADAPPSIPSNPQTNQQHDDTVQIHYPHEQPEQKQDEPHNESDQLEEPEQGMVTESPDDQIDQPANQPHSSNCQSPSSKEKDFEIDMNLQVVKATAAAAAATVAVVANSAISVSAVALAAEAVASDVATTTVPPMPFTTGILPTGSGGYATFAPLAPENMPIIGHPLGCGPMPIGRRAVRIAPMGILPLARVPHQGIGGLVGGMGSGGDLASGDGGVGGSGEVDVLLGGVRGGGAAVGTVLELGKGKRKGTSGTLPESTVPMSQEERTKQKRMLRNRESAARSRDKRKTKNMQLEASIERYQSKKVAIDEVITELQEIVDSMKQVLQKHNISVPC